MMRIFLFVCSCFFGVVSVLAGGGSDTIMCTMEYAPVCGSVQVQCITTPCDPVRQTFSNNCMARSAHATNITTGACDTSTPPVIAGGDRDIHGCIGSAGYSWDARLQKCTRPWETPKKLTPRELIQSGSWTLMSKKNIPMTGATMTFAQDGKIHIRACNILNGSYRASPTMIFVSRLMSTEMYCEGPLMSLENIFSSPRFRYTVQDETLTLILSGGEQILWRRKVTL